MTVPLRIGFVPIARPTFDTDLAGEVTGQARRHLRSKGWEVSGPEEMLMDMVSAQAVAGDLSGQPLDLLLLFQATFADSPMRMALAEAVDVPLMLWALPESPSGGRLRLNSLCGINLSAFSLREAGRRFRYAYASPEDPAVLPQVESLARAGRALRNLRQARVGVIGQHPEGFDPCHYDAGRLSGLLGVEVVPFELPVFFERVRSQPAGRVEAQLARLSQTLPNLPEPGTSETQYLCGKRWMVISKPLNFLKLPRRSSPWWRPTPGTATPARWQAMPTRQSAAAATTAW